MLSIRKEDKILLKAVFRFSQSQKVKLYIVGGYLRDILLNRQKENPDIDFSIKKGAIKFAKALSKKIKAGFVVLDKERGCCRLIKKIKDKIYTLDFADFRGSDLGQDLLHRDFTINAIALSLDKAISEKNFDKWLIDPELGRQDIKAKILRRVNKRSFDEDGLRILRAFSLASIFGFRIEKETLKQIKLKKTKLSGVSYERIRDELFKILSRPCAYQYLSQLDKLGILKTIMPEIEIMRGVKQGPYHHLDVLMHAFETLRQVEIIIEEKKNNKEISGYLNQVISGERKRLALVKLAAFLHDIGKPEALRYENGKTIFHGHERVGAILSEKIGEKFKLSNDELKALKKMVFWHLRPGYLADMHSLSARAKFRYFRDCAQEGASVLLISLADQRSTRGPLTSRQSRQRHEKAVSILLKEYFKKQKEQKLSRLVNGNDLMDKLKIAPGILVGRILSELEELQAAGTIKTKEDALRLAAKIKNRERRGG